MIPTFRLHEALGVLPLDRAASIAGECEDGMECMKAHNLCELRVLAAIQMGLVDMAFKTSICAAYEASQDCQQGNVRSALFLRVQDRWHFHDCWNAIHVLQT